MNSLENLEAALRGFRPRQPSQKLKSALFPSGRAKAVRRLNALFGPGIWAAPLTATAMLLLSVATAWPPTATVAAGLSLNTLPPGWKTTAMPPIEQNALPQPTFRSTTPGGMTSSFGSLLLRQTNVFAR